MGCGVLMCIVFLKIRYFLFSILMVFFCFGASNVFAKPGFITFMGLELPNLPVVTAFERVAWQPSLNTFCNPGNVNCFEAVHHMVANGCVMGEYPSVGWSYGWSYAYAAYICKTRGDARRLIALIDMHPLLHHDFDYGGTLTYIPDIVGSVYFDLYGKQYELYNSRFHDVYGKGGNPYSYYLQDFTIKLIIHVHFYDSTDDTTNFFEFVKFDCSKCKSDLALAKTRITSEASSILTLYHNSYQGFTELLPCNSLICLSDYSSYFSVFANSVPVFGFFAGTMIVFRRKRQSSKHKGK